MTDRKLEMAAAPAPWINQYGQAVLDNPWGGYRPNPAYTEWAQKNTVVPKSRPAAPRMRRSSQRRLQILAVVIVLATFVVGIKSAYAFWTVGGTGVGSAHSGTATVSVDASTNPGSPLYPGGNGTVRVSINNPNTFALKLTAVTANGSVTGSGGRGTCTTTGVTFTNQTGLSNSLPAGITTVIDFAAAATMSNASDDGCQNATFSVPVSISVRQP